MKRELFVCKCGNIEHQLILQWDDEWAVEDEKFKEVWVEVHLCNHRQWWKRVVPAIRHVLGYKSRYGQYDSIGLDKDQLDHMVQTLQTARKEVWSDGEEKR